MSVSTPTLKSSHSSGGWELSSLGRVADGGGVDSVFQF
jgi:hypothetical protein